MAVVVSAMSGVTDSLIELVALAASRNDSYLAKLQGLKEKHLGTMTQLSLSEEQNQSLAESLASDFKNIEEVLRGIWITGLPSEPHQGICLRPRRVVVRSTVACAS